MLPVCLSSSFVTPASLHLVCLILQMLLLFNEIKRLFLLQDEESKGKKGLVDPYMEFSFCGKKVHILCFFSFPTFRYRYLLTSTTFEVSSFNFLCLPIHPLWVSFLVRKYLIYHSEFESMFFFLRQQRPPYITTVTQNLNSFSRFL